MAFDNQSTPARNPEGDSCCRNQIKNILFSEMYTWTSFDLDGTKRWFCVVLTYLLTLFIYFTFASYLVLHKKTECHRSCRIEPLSWKTHLFPLFWLKIFPRRIIIYSIDHLSISYFALSVLFHLVILFDFRYLLVKISSWCGWEYGVDANNCRNY